MTKKLFVPALWFIVILYVLCIDLKGVWTDEGNRFTLFSGGKTWQEFSQSGQAGSPLDAINAVGPTYYQPAFYVLDNLVIRLARSHSAVLLRLVNLLWLVAALQGMLRLFRPYSDWVRLFGVVILALNGFMLMNVMQIREYPMYVALAIWSTSLCFELSEDPGVSMRTSWPRLAAYGALIALMFCCLVNAIYLILAQGVILLTRKENRTRFMRAMSAAYLFSLALVLPWLLMIFYKFPGKLNIASWDRRETTFALLRDSLRSGLLHILTYNTWDGDLLMQAFGLLVMAGIPLAWIATVWRREPLDRRALCGLLSILFYAAFQITYFFKGQALSVWPRYFIAYVPGYLLLATCAFATLERTARDSGRFVWKAAAAGVFLFVTTAGLAQVKLYRTDPYMDTGMTDACNWRVVTRGILQHIRPDETIAYYYPLQAWTMGVDNPHYTHELSYDQILAFNAPTVPSFWIFDTSVMPEFLAKVKRHLAELHYRETHAVDIGCQCKLFRYELEGAPAAGAGR